MLVFTVQVVMAVAGTGATPKNGPGPCPRGETGGKRHRKTWTERADKGSSKGKGSAGRSEEQTWQGPPGRAEGVVQSGLSPARRVGEWGPGRGRGTGGDWPTAHCPAASRTFRALP